MNSSDIAVWGLALSALGTLATFLTSARSNQLAQVKTTISGQEKLIQQMERQIARLEDQLDARDDENATLRREIDDLRREIAALRRLQHAQ